MSSEDTKMLEIKQYWKSDKTPSIIYADLEFFIKKNGCKNNPENYLQQKQVNIFPADAQYRRIRDLVNIEVLHICTQHI